MSKFKVLKDWEGFLIGEVVDSATFSEEVTEEAVAALIQDGTLEVVDEKTEEEKATEEAAAKELADKEQADKEAAEKSDNNSSGLSPDSQAGQVDSGAGLSVAAPERHPLA